MKVLHYVLRSAVVKNLVGRLLPPSSCQHQNIFLRISKLSRSKNSEKQELLALLGSKSFDCVLLTTHNVLLLRLIGGQRIFYVFAFVDFTAWNAAFGVDGEWRKRVYGQAPSIQNDYLEKIEINKSVMIVFVSQKSIFSRAREFCVIICHSATNARKVLCLWAFRGGGR